MSISGHDLIQPRDPSSTGCYKPSGTAHTVLHLVAAWSANKMTHSSSCDVESERIIHRVVPDPVLPVAARVSRVCLYRGQDQLSRKHHWRWLTEPRHVSLSSFLSSFSPSSFSSLSYGSETSSGLHMCNHNTLPGQNML